MKQLQPKQLLPEIVAGLFVILFLYTAIMKLKDIPFFIGSMEHSPVLRPYANLLAVLIPSIEIVITILLIIPTTRYVGLLLGTVLMAAFTIYVAIILYSMQELPCTCGGVLQQMNWREHLIFNSSFFLLGIIGILANKQIIAINRSRRTPVI